MTTTKPKIPAEMRETVRRLEELDARATEPPWQAETSGGGGGRVTAGEQALLDGGSLEDAALVASARNELPRLLGFAKQAFALAEAASDWAAAGKDDSDAAMKVRWALKNIGFHDESGEPCFRD